MRTVFIYGPPASGKLTIAQELEKQTNYFLFHNHLIVDFVKNILQFDTAEFWNTCLDIRKRMVSAFAKEKDGLIMTLVYDAQDDSLIEHIKKESESVLFVQLVCDVKTLHMRVGNESRKKFQKMNNRGVLSDFLEKYPVHKKRIDSKYHLIIDTDKLSPEQATQKIITYLKIHKM